MFVGCVAEAISFAQAMGFGILAAPLSVPMEFGGVAAAEAPKVEAAAFGDAAGAPLEVAEVEAALAPSEVAAASGDAVEFLPEATTSEEAAAEATMVEVEAGGGDAFGDADEVPPEETAGGDYTR